MRALPWAGSRTSGALWALAAGLTFWSFGFSRIAAGDLWWHLAAGRLIWEGRGLPATDPWSFTAAGRPWLNHEWLSDVVFHAWASLFGMPALAVWKWLVLVATFLLLFATLRRLSRNHLASYLAATSAAAVAAPFLDVRPHLWSLLGYCLLLALTLPGAAGPSPPAPLPSSLPVHRERGGSRARAWPPGLAWLLLPLLFLVWVNLHSGFFFGLMALATVLAARVLAGALERPFPGIRPLARSALGAAGLLATCALAALVNPHGVEPFLYPLKYAFDSSSPFRGLLEWQPPSVPGGMRSPLYPAAIAAAVGSALVLAAGGGFRRGRRAATLAGLALAALTLAMSWRSRRFIPLFAISQSLLLAPALSDLLAVVSRRLPARLRPAWTLGGAAAPLVALAVAAVRLAPYPLSPVAFHTLTAEDSFPVETCRAAVANGLAGRVFAYYNWGGYLELCAGGRLRVYIDGRADTVYDAATYRRYLRALYGEPDQVAIVEASGAEYVLWPRQRPALIEALEATGRWRRLAGDFVSVLLVRADVPAPQALRPTPESAHRELARGADAMREGRLAAAERHLARSLALAPWLEPACDNLALVQLHRGEPAAARATGRRCRRIFPGAEPPDPVRQLLDGS